MLITAIRERTEDELLWLLRYRTRRRILLAIGDAGKISATALRDSLKISTGSLYYNLRQLRGFVTQDKDRNYVLTEEGKRVYKALKEKGTVSAADLAEPESGGRMARILTNLFFPVWLYTPLYEQKVVTFIVPALGFVLSTVLLIYSRQISILMHFYPVRPNVFLTAGSYLLNTLALYGLITVVAILFSGVLFKGSKGESVLDRVRKVAGASLLDEVKFFSSLIVACLPLMIFPAILSLNRLLGLGLIPPERTPLYYQIRDVYLIIAQVATLPFLTALTAYGRRLNGATAALVTLVVFFVSHTIYQLLTVGVIA
ncbi:MAG: hypothetical protein J7J94_02070 [Thaumarchaeota archaeon]|nr:hypothetical protein [Nitrososphaerota archaeon]